MRVAPDCRLNPGDEFKVVIYGRASHAPLLLKAVVARNDGPAGCVLLFRDVPATLTAVLEQVVGSLPHFPAEERSPYVVVSEIIEDA